MASPGFSNTCIVSMELCGNRQPTWIPQTAKHLRDYGSMVIPLQELCNQRILEVVKGKCVDTHLAKQGLLIL